MEKQFQTYLCLELFLRKVAIGSEYLIVMGVRLQSVVPATEKARLSILSLVLGITICLETEKIRYVM